MRRRAGLPSGLHRPPRRASVILQRDRAARGRRNPPCSTGGRLLAQAPEGLHAQPQYVCGPGRHPSLSAQLQRVWSELSSLQQRAAPAGEPGEAAGRPGAPSSCASDTDVPLDIAGGRQSTGGSARAAHLKPAALVAPALLLRFGQGAPATLQALWPAATPTAAAAAAAAASGAAKPAPGCAPPSARGRKGRISSLARASRSAALTVLHAGTAALLASE